MVLTLFCTLSAACVDKKRNSALKHIFRKAPYTSHKQAIYEVDGAVCWVCTVPCITVYISHQQPHPTVYLPEATSQAEGTLF